MDDAVYEGAGEVVESVDGRGRGFGSRVHEFAEDYALDREVTPSNDDERHIVEFLDGLEGDLYVEEPARLPLDVDGERVTISGVVDLVHVTPNRVEIIDYKTDLSRRAEGEYRKQLSVYYHVLTSEFQEREVTMGLYYTADGERVTLQPLSTDELRGVVRERNQ